MLVHVLHGGFGVENSQITFASLHWMIPWSEQSQHSVSFLATAQRTADRQPAQQPRLLDERKNNCRSVESDVKDSNIAYHTASYSDLSIYFTKEEPYRKRDLSKDENS